MGNEIAIREEDRGYLPERAMRLVEWAHEADAAYKLAENLCKTAFAGAYKGDPFGAAAAILKGAEVGLTPVTSLGAFDLINGVPAPKAITLRALAQSHGHRVWIESSTDAKCVAKAIRKGENEVHESVWTIARATGLGISGKDNWKKQPQAMLMARATSEVCRLVAADVILGIGYSAEELSDDIASVVEIKRETKPKLIIARATASQNAQEVEEPEFDDEPDEKTDIPAVNKDDSADQSTESEDKEEGISSAQIKTIGAAMTRLGMTDRNVAIAYVGDVVQREITSRKDLTKDEASKVIRSLLADEDSADKKYQEELKAQAEAEGIEG